MNAYAKKIGMQHSHFVNPTRLSADGHITTAHDLALLGRALIHDYPATYAYNKICLLYTSRRPAQQSPCAFQEPPRPPA